MTATAASDFSIRYPVTNSRGLVLATSRPATSSRDQQRTPAKSRETPTQIPDQIAGSFTEHAMLLAAADRKQVDREHDEYEGEGPFIQ